MPYFPPNPRRGPIQPRYRQGYGPSQGRFVQPFYYPYQQPQTSRVGRLPQHLNTLMGHAGTITNGVNMIRQMGYFLSLFR